MVKMLDKKTYDSVKIGVMDGMESALKQAKRVEWRAPWVYHRPRGSRPWVLGLTMVAAAIATIVGLRYLRKRKEVAERYTMGENDSVNGFDSNMSSRDTVATTSPGVN